MKTKYWKLLFLVPIFGIFAFDWYTGPKNINYKPTGMASFLGFYHALWICLLIVAIILYV